VLFQKADGFQCLGVGSGSFAEVGCVTIGLTIGLVAHLLKSLLCADLFCSIRRAHKAEQPFHTGAGLDVDQVHTVAAGAVGRKLMLRQKCFKIPGQIGAGREKLQIIFLLRIDDRSAAQKSCANVCTDAGLAANKAGVDLQAGLVAGGTKQLMHPRNLLRCADIEFIEISAGTVLFQDLALNAASCK